MDKREQRRDRTWRKGAARRRHHLKVVHPDGQLDCVCERSVWFFDRRRALGCRCRTRHRGNPKYRRGICGHLVAPGALERRRWRAALTRLRQARFEDADPFVPRGTVDH